MALDSARESQHVVEVMTVQSGQPQISQAVVEAMTQGGTPRASQFVVEVMGPFSSVGLVSQFVVEVMTPSPASARQRTLTGVGT